MGILTMNFREKTHTSAGGAAVCSKRRRGFVLIMTVVLLAFVVLLLVSVASLTRVETSVATNYQNLTKARQNALMGLNIAIGQLQKHAGPDQRVTAANETSHYTGVWNTNNGSLSWGSPDVWLISGSESTSANVTAGNVILVSATSAAREVTVPRVTIEANFIKGYKDGENVAIGRYAYWVGDQGVKAPVGHASRVQDVKYQPWDTIEARQRLWMRVASNAQTDYFDTRNTTIANRINDELGSALRERVVQLEQLSFLGGNVTMDSVRENFHDWSVDNFAVLANTANTTLAGSNYTGLRLDLSRVPEELGDAFVRYAGLAYMDDLKNPESPQPIPAINRYSSRRRYKMEREYSANVKDSSIGGQLMHTVHPVLTHFYIAFNIQGQGGDTKVATPLEMRAWALAALWNPYSSALVPPKNKDMWLRITGLPKIINVEGVVEEFRLEEEFTGSSNEFRINLPFSLNGRGTGYESGVRDDDEDVRSWLPGRTYFWTAGGGDPGNWDTTFYDRTSNPASDLKWVIPKTYELTAPSSTIGRVSGEAAPNLKIELMMEGYSEPLATYICPPFKEVDFPARAKGSSASPQFVYAVRLNAGSSAPINDCIDGGDPDNWLKTAERNPVEPILTGESGAVRYFSSKHGVDDPNEYGGSDFQQALATATDRKNWCPYNKVTLFTRVMGKGASSKTFNYDAPVFELPREPILSLGELKHLHVKGKRPFMIGNSWGGRWNKLFDQYFFTGLADLPNESGVKLSDFQENNYVLPNYGLVPVANADGSLPTSNDIADNGHGAQYLLQAAAFNINSVSKVAWKAVLRGVNSNSMPKTDLDRTTGASSKTASETAPDTIMDNLALEDGRSYFFRFAQSFQETYLYRYGSGSVVGYDVPADYGASRQKFRQSASLIDMVNHDLSGDSDKGQAGSYTNQMSPGMNATQVDELAEKIVENIRKCHASTGPFRSLEEFLNTHSALGGRSVLDKSLKDAFGVGAGDGDDIVLSSLITQGDIMTALAPILYARSDTFIIRAYGETLNPAIDQVEKAVEGRAWCEALVQRIPRPQAVVDRTSWTRIKNPTGVFGREFKIISFRWLNESDL